MCPPRRVTEFISCLEHTHFSDASLQPPVLTALPQHDQQGGAVEPGLELGGECWTETPELGSSQPLTPPPSVQELLGEGGRGGRGRAELKSSSLMSGSSAAKAVCVLSTQADRCVCDPASSFIQLFSDAALAHLICLHQKQKTSSF